MDDRTDQDAPSLPREVPEAEASGDVARLYDEIRVALRSPNVNLIYRLLARYPDYLAAAWRQIQPNLASRYLEREAERLRALAALDIGPSAGRLGRELSPLGIPTDDVSTIRAVVDLFNYANPKNLIVITALRMALDGRAISGTEDVEGRLPVPGGPLPDVDVRLVDPGSASPGLRAILAEIVAAHQTNGAMPSVYRALANWPAFLQAAWQAVRPFLSRPELAARVHLLIEEAERSARGLPYPVDLSTTEAERIGGPEATRVIGETLELFRTQMIPAMTVEIHTLKALLDGQHAASSSPLAWRP